MKKILILVLIILGFMPFVIAQDVTFYVVKNDGTTTSHAMSTSSKIYYSDTQLFFDDYGTTISYNLSELRKAYFAAPQDVEEVANQQLTIYPNPAKDVLNIKNLADNQEVTIYSMNGAVIMKTIVSGDAEINISELRPGMYVVSAGNLVSKFIKM
ncbi:MAG: T9SS type A sorting domain-containing protein [Bacteroidales bacterium]|nr:T9SS type A sorting domain-containing protein [Bacteroidales bacterium]